MAYKLEKLKNFFLKNRLNLRYNHYHNPVNGQFASGKGSGEGLFYSMGKGKGGAVVGASSEWNAPKPAKKELDADKIQRANAQNSMFYEAGDAIKNRYDKEYDEINKLNLSDEEKEEAHNKIYDYASKELDARQHVIGWDVAGPARGVGTKSDKSYDKALKIKGEHEAYMDELRSKSKRNAQKQADKELFEALKAATDKGEKEVTINGKTYRRGNKKSMTWKEVAAPT